MEAIPAVPVPSEVVLQTHCHEYSVFGGMKVADNALAPAMRGTDGGTPVLADGFSCAMQVRQLDGARATLHLAQLLDPDPRSD
ncbi:hypothetical protein QFZ79_003775 [Arthrobacter sp. V4I6]|nr:hypothetical protein [Arthrobacter sp. V1I7]MDQ0855664.1 hypothetical protein [Arthrobacter sp. V4I6]